MGKMKKQVKRLEWLRWETAQAEERLRALQATLASLTPVIREGTRLALRLAGLQKEEQRLSTMVRILEQAGAAWSDSPDQVARRAQLTALAAESSPPDLLGSIPGFDVWFACQQQLLKHQPAPQED